MKETYGQKPSNAFAWLDQDTHFWRTSQGYLIPDILEQSSVIWPKSGMTVDGHAYRRRDWEQITRERGCGYLPTPTAGDSKRGVTPYDGKRGQSLIGIARNQMWPTPAARDWRSGKASQETMEKNARPLNEVVVNQEKFPTPQAFDATGITGNLENRKKKGGCSNLKDVVGGTLSPDWVDWLMGCPIGYSALKHLETGKFQSWLQQHSNF